MAQLAEDAEAERDAERSASRKWAASAAGTAGTIGAYLATTGVGAVVGGAIIAAAAIAYGAYEGILAIQDYFEHDYDGDDAQGRVKTEIAWYLDRSLPFPEFSKARHGHLEMYADELAGSRESIELMPPDNYRAALLRGQDRFRASIASSDPVVLAALLVGGEGGRSWTYVRSLTSEANTKTDPKHIATNAQAADLLVAAIGVTAAQAQALPSTHWYEVILGARNGWARGVAEGIASAYEHTGSVGFAVAVLAAEDSAAGLRARLDAAEVAAPGTLGGIFGLKYATVATIAGSRFDRFAREAPTATRRAPQDVPQGALDLAKPPAPPSSPAVPVAVGGTLLAAGALWILKSAAAAGVRRILGL